MERGENQTGKEGGRKVRGGKKRKVGTTANGIEGKGEKCLEKRGKYLIVIIEKRRMCTLSEEKMLEQKKKNIVRKNANGETNNGKGKIILDSYR